MPIASQHSEYSKMLPKWKRCRDAASGQDAVHEAGATYLPMLHEQSSAEYTAYKTRAGFYNAFWRTLSGMVGMVMRQAPVVEVPASVELMRDDITLSGIPLNSFAQTILEEALQQGRVGVLVDSPTVLAPSGAATMADAIAQNIRPMLQMYRAESAINWKMERVNNVMKLTLVVLEESEDVSTDEYSSVSEKRWRELTLFEGIYRVRIFKLEADIYVQVGEDVFPTMGGQHMPFIPFLFISADDLTPEVDDPPLIDLVDVNLAHYRVTADYENGCHFTGLPTPVVSGYIKSDPGEKLYVGSSQAWVFPDPATTASYMTFGGDGLRALTDNLARKEQQMAVLGARMLEPQRQAVESADTANVHRKGEESLLSAAAQNVSRGMTIALRWMTEWAGADPAQTTFAFNDTFYPSPMSTGMLASILAGWNQGAPGFSSQEVFAKLQKGGMIAIADNTFEAEEARIANKQIELQGQQGAFNEPQE